MDTKTLAWEQLEPLGKGPSARSGHRCCAWRGKVLLFGGFYKASADVAAKFHNDAWLYAPSENAWRPLQFSTAPGVAKPPVRSGGVFSVGADFSAVVWGGYSEVTRDRAGNSKRRRFMFAASACRRRPLEGRRRRHAAVVLSRDVGMLTSSSRGMSAC